jgi:hypothetical protein
MNTWKWSTGETYYRSPRQQTDTSVETNNYSYDSQLNAINQSLNDYGMDKDMINITNSVFSRNQNPTGTRREDLDTKIADREMIAQRGYNPFLQTSYVNDVVTHDIFLKPQNTTHDQIKVDNKDNEN